jgi:ubiquinol-cytochrome c reductase cytochrome b subunit
MYSYHVLLLPAAVVGIVIAHVLLVRRHGVVPPFNLPSSAAARAHKDSAPTEAEVPL